MKSCISCKKAIENDVSSTAFACPSCNSEIIRCGSCRKGSVQYRCSSCNEFGGP